MGAIWKLTTNQQVSAKRGSSSFAVPKGVSFTVITSSTSQPQPKEIEGPFLKAISADSLISSCTTSWFKIEKA